MNTSNEDSLNSENPNQASNGQQSQKSGPRKMTTEEYVRENHPDLNDSARVSWEDDKEGDFEHKGYAAVVAIDWSIDSGNITLSDYDSVREEMLSDADHPITKLIWRKPKKK